MLGKSRNKSISVDVNQKQVAEWDSNDCGFCILCNTPFSIFRNRKHHCRKCGRLICESCSSRRMKLDSNVAFSPHAKQTDQPQRVCDPCYLMLTKKEEQKIEHVVKRDKHVELLMTSSVVSESLIDVFFLDGSYKTICYDAATTVSELANNICFSVKIALFEVLQDINDPRQYQLLKPAQTVAELVQKWRTAKLKYCKIVLPLYDLFSAYPNFTTDNYKSALKRVYPAAPLDHSLVADPARTVSTSTLNTTTTGSLLPHHHHTHQFDDSGTLVGHSGVGVGGSSGTHVIDVRSDAVAAAAAALEQQLHDARFDDHSSRASSNAIEVEDPTTFSSSVDFHGHSATGRSSFGSAGGGGAPHYFSPTKANLDSPARLTRDLSAGTAGGLFGAMENAAKEAEIKKLKMELDAVKEKLNKSNRQNDMLRSLCMKHGQLSTHQHQHPHQQHHLAHDHMSFSSFSDHYSSTMGASRDSISDSNNSSTRHDRPDSRVAQPQPPPPPSILFKDQVSKESLEKRNSFTWASLGFGSGNKSSGNLNSNSNSSHRPSMSGAVVTGGNSALLTSPPQTLKKSTSVATFNALNNNSINTTSSSSSPGLGGTLNASAGGGRNSFYVNRQSISSRYLSSESAVGLDLNLEVTASAAVSLSQDPLVVKMLDQQDELMASPLRVLDLDGPSFTLFVRTYYHKISELELFCNKFDRVFSTLLTHEYAASAPSKDQEEQEEQDSRLTDLVTSSNTAANSCIAPVPSQDTMDLSPKSLATSSQSQQHQQQPRGKFNSNSIVHLYHMIVAIDGVYEFLMTDFEVWRNAMKTWLLRIFTEAIKLPVLQPDDLRAAVLCLQKEQLMYENEVIDIISATIDTALTHNVSSSGHVTTSATTTTTATRETLLVPAPLIHSSNQRNEETFQRTAARGGSGSTTASAVSAASVNKYNFTHLSQYMDNIISTFSSIVGDLIHIIPDEIQVMGIYMTKAQRIIKEEIKLSYYTHKASMLNSELMAIYKFLDTLIKLFAQFGIEKEIVTNLTEFMNDVFKQAHASTLTLMSTTIGRLHSIEMAALNSFQQRQSYDDLEDYNVLSSGGSTYNMYDRVYTSSWSDDLNALLKSQLTLIPPAVASTIKVYLCLQLLDTLAEYNEKQSTWLKQFPLKLSVPSFDKLCLFINNQYYFVSLISDTIEAWAYEVEDHYMSKISEKLEAISKLYKESAISAGEILTRILCADIKDILRHEKNGLFTKSWENSVKSLTMLKGCLKKHLSGVCYNLNNDIDGCTEMRQSIVYEACSSAVSIYIEAMLCSPTISLSTLNNVTNIGSTTGTSHTQERLMEDVEVLTKLFEELRASKAVTAEEEKPIVYTTQNAATTAASSNAKQYKRKKLTVGIVGSLFRRSNSSNAGSGGGMQRSNSSADLKASVSSENLASLSHTGGSSNNLAAMAVSPGSGSGSGSGGSSVTSNKQKFSDLLKPLTHIVFACQMEGQDLVEFVKQELYLDFGVVCVRLWQLLMHWKAERKDLVEEAFHEAFDDWTPRRLQGDPLMTLPYLNNNIIRRVTFLK